MPVVTRHSSLCLRFMLAVIVALALMPACFMLVCAAMDFADPACIAQSQSLIDPATSAGGLAGTGGTIQSLLLAFVALAAAIVSVRFSEDLSVTSFSGCDHRSGPIPPPRRGSTPLLI